MSVVSPQGSYWAIDTNPKEDTVPSRPKKRPRSGERVNFSFSFLKKKKNNKPGKTEAGAVEVEAPEREKRSCREGGVYSSPAFQLITTESPGAAFRHISSAVFFLFLFQTLINSEPCHLVLHGWALRPLFLRLACTACRHTPGCHMGRGGKEAAFQRRDLRRRRC